ncbi:MAG: transposase, partial [Rubrivivax sp.]
GCAHSYVVVGDRKPRDLPQFTWVNTVLGNLKNMIDGAYKAFDLRKYAQRYLGTFSYRFNRLHDLAAIVSGLVRHAANATPFPERALRRVAEVSH